MHVQSCIYEYTVIGPSVYLYLSICGEFQRGFFQRGKDCQTTGKVSQADGRNEALVEKKKKETRKKKKENKRYMSIFSDIRDRRSTRQQEEVTRHLLLCFSLLLFFSCPTCLPGSTLYVAISLTR